MLDEVHNPPSDRRMHIKTRDVEMTCRALESIYGDTRVVATRGQFEWHAQSFHLGPIAFIRAHWNDAVQVHGAPLVYVLSLSVGGFAQASQNGCRGDIAQNQTGAVASPGRDSSWNTSGAFSATTIRIDPHFLTAQLEALTGSVVTSPLVFDVSMSFADKNGAFLDRLCQLVVKNIEDDSPLAEPLIMSGLNETLTRLLLTGQPHNHSHLLSRPAPPVGRHEVRNVEAYLEANAHEAVSMGDLTTLTGASGRSIESGFREHRGTTPGRVLQTRRMEEARRMLLADPHVPVQRVAFALGFLKTETFEAIYSRMFKESPTDTRRRGLVSVGAAMPYAEAILIASLSPRERQVCERVARGMLNKQIAAELGTTLDTVKKQRGKAMKKLGVTSVVELVRLLERGLWG